MALDPYLIRIEKESLAAIIKSNNNSLYLYPISHQVLIKKIFELAGIKSELSLAGLITKKIIEKLGELDEGRVFKISVVRKMLQTLKTDECITRGEGTKMIQEDEKFKKYEELYIEPWETPKLKVQNVFDFLLKKDFLRPGLELICSHCKLSNWLSLQEINDIWKCNYCGNDNKTSLQLKDRGDWKFRKSGFFAKDNNQEGTIPVVLTLLVFLRIFETSEFIYSPSLKLEIDNKFCEIDFCV